MNVFGFDTVEASSSLVALFLWGIFFGNLIGLVRYILFGLGLRVKKPWREGKEVIKNG